MTGRKLWLVLFAACAAMAALDVWVLWGVPAIWIYGYVLPFAGCTTAVAAVWLWRCWRRGRRYAARSGTRTEI